jgi:hypothetical protein
VPGFTIFGDLLESQCSLTLILLFCNGLILDPVRKYHVGTVKTVRGLLGRWMTAMDYEVYMIKVDERAIVVYGGGASSAHITGSIQSQVQVLCFLYTFTFCG